MVNPLTVATNKSGKKRLVLDCRHLNDCLAKFKFKYEDATVARQLFDRGTHLFSWDLRSAYHHISVFSAHRQYLGFQLKEGQVSKYYVFCALPFGLSTSGYVFFQSDKGFGSVLECFRTPSGNVSRRRNRGSQKPSQSHRIEQSHKK